jgi:hypothetical protein
MPDVVVRFNRWLITPRMRKDNSRLNQQNLNEWERKRGIVLLHEEQSKLFTSLINIRQTEHMSMVEYPTFVCSEMVSTTKKRPMDKTGPRRHLCWLVQG